MPNQLVTETIDVRLLRLIGLEDVFDLDYDTYFTLLREAQVTGKNRLHPEELALLANERKRIRGKVGRFKPKAITADNITTVKSIGKKLLPSAKGVGSAPIVKSLASIGAIVESISGNLTEQSKEDKKEAEEQRKAEETKKRKKREETLETGTKKVVDAAKKLFSPVKGILDSIFNYLFYTFLGKGITEAFNWLADPKNKEKISAISRFVKDFWPSLLGAAAFFFTPLGGFIRATLGLLKTASFKIASFLVANPMVAAGLTTGLAAAVGTGQERKRIEEIAKQQGTTAPKFGEGSWFDVFGQSLNLIGSGLQGISSGGFIDSNTGVKITGAGPDTQLTALQPGEVVMNRSAVKALGANNLLNLNRLFGGANANRPKFAGNIQLAQGGGLIGALSNILPRTGTVMAPKGAELGYQDKFLGMNVGSFRRLPLNMTYPTENVQRYNLAPSAPSKLVQFESGPLRGRHISIRKSPGIVQSTKSVGPRPSSGLNPFQNFSRNVQTIKGTAQKQEQMMKQMGYKPSGYVNIFGQQIQSPKPNVLGPQSRVQLPSLPPGRSKTNILNLPPVYETAMSSQTPSAQGTEVPSFSAVAPGNKRMENAQIYGLMT